MFLRYSFVWKRTVTVNLKNFFLDDILLGNFILSNLIFSLEDLIRGNRLFEIFLIDHYAGDIENSCISVTHHILGALVHIGCYTHNSLVHIIYVLFICM